MAIKFQCPKCKTPYSVKDELAGKKAACKKCKEVITIPAPAQAVQAAPATPAAPPPPADAESLAASVLADEPPPVVAEPTTVDFTCPECEAKLQLPAELAGKRTQCPECKNLIKVPEIVKQQPLDWRKAQQRGPSGARANVEPAPDGAWSSTATERVSREALLEAGAIPEELERLTRTQKVVRIVVGVAVLALVGGVGFTVWRLVAQSREARAVERALAAVTKDTGQWPPEARAEVYRGAGLYYLRTNQRGCVEKAQANLAKARGQLMTQSTSSEHDPIAIDLALTQLDMGSDQQPEIDNRQRLSWKGDVLKELRPTLDLVRPEARLEAIRAVCRKLVEKGQPAQAAPVAMTMFSANDGLRAEGLAIAGLEIAKADPATAEALANKALDLYIPPPEPKHAKAGAKPPRGKEPAAAGPPISPSLVALCQVLEKPALVKRLPPEARGEQGADRPVPPAVMRGNIDALARKGNVADARQMVGRFTSPLDRLAGYVVIAEALAQEPPGSSKQDVDAAAQIVLGDLRGRQLPPWLLLRLVQLGVRAGLADESLKGLAQAIQDPGLRSWAELEILRGRLAAGQAKAADDRTSAVENKKAAASFLAWEAVARNNAHFDGGTLTAAEAWDEAVRPYGAIGAVLGWQDGR